MDVASLSKSADTSLTQPVGGALSFSTTALLKVTSLVGRAVQAIARIVTVEMPLKMNMVNREAQALSNEG